jgi:tetratricopeptide (TPR) repeat protein
VAGVISIAMIVKDEADHLGDCLAAVQDLADELCIVDTGSRDNTLEIARQSEARVSVFLWCDDFSAARNESLRLCTGDWVFVIDADERVAPEDIAAIRALANGPRDCCYRFTTRNYTNSTKVDGFRQCEPGDCYARDFAGWYPSIKIRFFPNSSAARFEGQVHELVTKSMERLGVRILDCDVPIHHYALLKSPEQVRKKQELYLDLGHKKVASQPSEPRGYVELGRQYAEAGDYQSAAGAYRAALQRDPSNAEALMNLGGALHALKRSDEARKSLLLALELDPAMSGAWRNLGVVYADQKNWDAAIECFERGMATNPRWTEGHRYKSVALEGAGRLAEAAEAVRKALEAQPDSLECLKLFTHQMLRMEQREPARRVLLGIIDAGSATAALHNTLGELYFYDKLTPEACTHFQIAAEMGFVPAYNNLGVALFKERRFEDAKSAFENCLGGDPSHRGARRNLEKVLSHLNGS